MKLLALPASVAALVLAIALPAYAQYPPPTTYSTILKSPLNPNITVSYKSPDPGTCETAFSTQKQYTGYVGIPPSTLAPIQQNYSINTFFWFVEARQLPEAAPLTIWLNGGPGSSSMIGFFNGNGPCQVVQMQDGSYGTQSNLWGWDRSSNMLFIDQPNLVGFSYDTPTNASFNFFTSQVSEPRMGSNNLPPYMYQNGTYSTASIHGSSTSASANTSEIAARATWHFLQTWLAAFPQYNPAVRSNNTTPEPANGPAGVNFFTESYGGKYGPIFASYFQEQNQLLASGGLQNALEIQLETVGIINGLIDDAVQDYYYPIFAYNNTYNIQAITQTQQLNTLSQITSSTGCLAQIQSCRALARTTDPNDYGDVADTNELCKAAQLDCQVAMLPYLLNGYDPYDIRRKLPSPDPPGAYQEYLNTASLLKSIGAPVNYTESNRYVQAGFIATGDTNRGGTMDDLAQLLRMGIRVALIYGDADFLCNWYGGQAVSLAVAQQLTDYPSVATPYASAFPAAGYAEVVTNQSYVGGAVRQYGNFSFSRVYDSGHEVSYYQPETAYTVFARIIQGTDISTGEIVDLSKYGSAGPANATHTNKAPSSTPSSTCWIRNWNMSCSADETRAMLSGKGVVQNGIFYIADSDISLPSSSVTAGLPGKPMGTAGMERTSGTSSMPALTGVYTATATPSGRAMSVRPLAFDLGIGPVLALLFAFSFGVFLLL